MPKKITPKYGIDPVQEVPAFSFTDAQIKQLFDALGPAKGGRHEIIAQLERCARDYFWRRKQNQEKPRRAEQAALKEVGHLARVGKVGQPRYGLGVGAYDDTPSL